MAAPSSGTAALVLSLGGWQMGVAETLVLHTSGLPRAHTKGPELQERCRAEQGRRPPLSVGQQPHQARRLLSISPTVCGFPSAAPVAGFLGPSRSQLRFIREPVSHRRTEPAHERPHEGVVRAVPTPAHGAPPDCGRSGGKRAGVSGSSETPDSGVPWASSLLCN